LPVRRTGAFGDKKSLEIYGEGPQERSHSHFFSHFTFLLNQKNSSKTKHKKTDQRNNVEHKEITLKDKNRKNQHISIVSCHYGLPDSIGKGVLKLYIKILCFMSNFSFKGILYIGLSHPGR